MKTKDFTEKITKATQGDRKAQEFLVNSVKDKIFNISMYFTGDFHLAQDCTQEILIKLIQNLNKLKDASKFENWSYTIAANYLRNLNRGNKKYAGITFEAMEAESTLHLNSDFTTTEKEEELKDFAYELKVSCTTAMLMCLSKEDRVLFLLANLLGLKSKQIGEIIDISAETARKRLSRANKKLKNFIDKNCGLLNKNNSCKCTQRVNYARMKGRLSRDVLYFQNKDYLSENEFIENKIAKMEELEDIGEVFKNNPSYTISKKLLQNVYRISDH